VNEINNPKSVPDPRKFLEGWFFNTPIEHISRSDVMKWIAGMCFNKHPETLNESETSQAHKLIDFLETGMGHRFPCTYNGTKTMLLTLDPIEMMPRPLIFYAATKSMFYATRVSLWALGFERKTHPSITLYIRKGSNDAVPIVFFHGIGIGITPYLRFVHSIVATYPDRTLILFEMSSVAMQLKLNHMLPEDCAKIYYQELQSLKIDRISAIGHSLGTISMCWLDRFYPHLIESRIYIDPVCFSLWTHHIARNFVYRSPEKTVHYLFKYLVAMEPGIALYLRRYFVWHQNTYYSSNLPLNAKIYLSESDDVVNSEYISNYLDRFPHGTRSYTIIPAMKHGQMLLTGKYQPIIDDIGQLQCK
jgi:pimeloyl-ACP methyl ester carboxylesterase